LIWTKNDYATKKVANKDGVAKAERARRRD